jgi:hypothetical protein
MYTYNDASPTATHSLNLYAKGYIYWTSGQHGDSGSVTLPKNDDGTANFGDTYSGTALLDVKFNTATMYIPDSAHKINPPADPDPGSSAGTTRNAQQESSQKFGDTGVTYNTVIPSTGGTGNPIPRSSGTSSLIGYGGALSRSVSSGSLQLTPLKTPDLTGDVVIGNVSASFVDGGSGQDCSTKDKKGC